jgi:hypothetical protein
MSELTKIDLTETEKKALIDLQAELPALQENNTNANWQIAKYKEDVASLETNEKKLVMIFDFTKFNQVREGHVHDMVVVLLRKPSEERNPLYEYFKPDVEFRDFFG